jgi:hypothetical protein
MKKIKMFHPGSKTHHGSLKVKKFFRKYVRNPVAHAPMVSWSIPFEAVVAAMGLRTKDRGSK